MFEIIFLILLGAVFIFLETILVGGVWCIAGIGLCSWAVWLSYAQFGSIGAVVSAMVSILACVGAFWFWLKVLPKTSFGKKIYLSGGQSGKSSNTDLKSLIGKEATTVSLLVPTGKVSIAGNIYDARCEMSHIDSGEKVEVVGADTFCLIVRKI